MKRKKFISIPHYENSKNKLHDDTYYNLIKNSSQEFKDEIHDIYFGKIFRYEYNNRKKRYCNPMGVEATDAQIDSLFKIQDEFGIEISLTINSIETPHELLHDANIAKEFIAFIKSFYDRGLRSCTIGSPHLIKSRLLHENFPDMRWKNTVIDSLSARGIYMKVPIPLARQCDPPVPLTTNSLFTKNWALTPCSSMTTMRYQTWKACPRLK